VVVDVGPEHWLEICKQINKFFWNRNFHAAVAPHRMKDIVNTIIENGGLGMINLCEVVMAARHVRFSMVMETGVHPIAELQAVLGGIDHLKKTAKVKIEDVTDSVLHTIYVHIHN
jgi:hypothetical protein